MSAAALVPALRRALGAPQVLTGMASRIVYSRDASHLTLGLPLCVCLPTTPEQARQVVALCAEHHTPWVVRGGGTGLAGGALPPEGAVVIAMGRLTTLGAVDPVLRGVSAQAGVRNEEVSRLAAAVDLHFAPDPSSQAASTIGGNVAANAGGPHCLKVGVTVQHLRRLDWIDAAGRSWRTGRNVSFERGIGLLGLLTGSEGTLGLVTGADLALLPLAPAVVTLLADFPRLDDATAAVVTLLGAGLLPAAVEIVDRPMLAAVEAAFRFGFPTDVDAVMIAELSGVSEGVLEDADRATRLLREGGARSVRVATAAAERAALWRCRKRAFGAVGRLAPAYVSMDVVVPLGSLPLFVRDVQAIKRDHGVEIATVFHAGDGNLHPGIHYDDGDPDSVTRAHAAADAIVLRALALGGSATGEHGVGLEKRHIVHHQLDARSGALMHAIKDLCDPQHLANPDKKLPPRDAAYAPPPPVPVQIDFHWTSLTLTAPAGASLAAIQAEALQRGLWIPIGATLPVAGALPGLGRAGTVGEAVAMGICGPSLLGTGSVADALVELWAETGDGRIFHAGAPVAKNVAGYDLVRLLCGSGEVLARTLAATFLLRPAPAAFAHWSWHREARTVDPAMRPALVALLRRAPQAVVGALEIASTGVRVDVLAAGRDRPWDLGRYGAELEAWGEEFGLGRAAEQVREGGALADPAIATDLPGWVRGAPDWTLLSAAQVGADWPDTARGIWQSRPEVVWRPQEAPQTPAGWHADTIYRDAVATLPPAPSVDVPRELLVGLKHLFDPDGTLPAPTWLVAPTHVVAP